MPSASLHPSIPNRWARAQISRTVTSLRVSNRNGRLQLRTRRPRGKRPLGSFQKRAAVSQRSTATTAAAGRRHRPLSPQTRRSVSRFRDTAEPRPRPRPLLARRCALGRTAPADPYSEAGPGGEPLPRRCGGESPPWPRRGWRRFRQRRLLRVLRGSASTGRCCGTGDTSMGRRLKAGWAVCAERGSAPGAWGAVLQGRVALCSLLFV